MAPISGQAAGVPFVAVPPAGDSNRVVFAWHLLDPPRSESALAAALPLEGLDAWRIYLGLPLSGSRSPGLDDVMQRGFEDAVLKLDMPVVYGAAEEFGPAFDELRGRLGIDPAAVGVLGGSAGAAVAQLVLAESGVDVRAAVLVSPVVQLRRKIEAGERLFGFQYRWSAESEAVADRLDFVARADELDAPTMLVVGEDDDRAFRESAAALASALGQSELVTVPGMGHALAEEPGVEPAPQTPHAAVVDGHAVRWFERHLR
jgi:pimeloyl-ACP methyl ester carboxylesterase